jgi:hypothetical protein
MEEIDMEDYAIRINTRDLCEFKENKKGVFKLINDIKGQSYKEGFEDSWNGRPYKYI